MPDFVKENSLDADELSQQLAKEKADNEQFAIQNQERKTLRDQLRESGELKKAEYHKLQEERNSSYKLDEESYRFYQLLKEAEQQKETQRKIEEIAELNRYRELKEASKKNSLPPPSAKPISFKRRKIPENAATKVQKISPETKVQTTTPNKPDESEKSDDAEPAKQLNHSDASGPSKKSAEPKSTGLVSGYSSDED